MLSWLLLFGVSKIAPKTGAALQWRSLPAPVATPETQRLLDCVSSKRLRDIINLLNHFITQLGANLVSSCMKNARPTFLPTSDIKDVTSDAKTKSVGREKIENSPRFQTLFFREFISAVSSPARWKGNYFQPSIIFQRTEFLGKLPSLFLTVRNGKIEALFSMGFLIKRVTYKITYEKFKSFSFLSPFYTSEICRFLLKIFS